MKHLNVTVIIIVRTKLRKYYSCNPTTCTCQIGKHLKIIADTSVIMCDEIIHATDVQQMIPTNVTSTVSTNFMSTMSVNSV